MMNIAVFASGTGSNFAAIAREVKQGKLSCGIKLLVCDNPLAKVIDKARNAGVEVFVIDRGAFAEKKDFENAIAARLKKDRIDLIVLAGFMRLLSAQFVRAFHNRIINIHPALLPAFKGGHAIADAFAYGAKLTGVTVHFVDERMDHGPIIAQEAIPIKDNDTLAALEKRIHGREHKLYPKIIGLFTRGRVRVRGRKVVITRK